MNKKTIIIGTLVLVLPVAALVLSFIQHNSPKVIFTQVVADLSEDRLLVGVAENVFVAKIRSEISNESLAGIPATQFSAEIISNLKGNLEGKVVIEQLPEEDVIVYDSDNKYRHKNLLKVGSTYIFTTLHDSIKNRQTTLPHPNAYTLVSEDSSLTTEQLEELLTTNKRYAELNEALKHQISLEEYQAAQRKAETMVDKGGEVK